jgi:hypothetical protein
LQVARYLVYRFTNFPVDQLKLFFNNLFHPHLNPPPSRGRNKRGINPPLNGEEMRRGNPFLQGEVQIPVLRGRKQKKEY